MARDFFVYGIYHTHFLNSINDVFNMLEFSQEEKESFQDIFKEEMRTDDFLALQDYLFKKKGLYSEQQIERLQISEVISYRSKNLIHIIMLVVDVLFRELSSSISKASSIKWINGTMILEKAQILDLLNGTIAFSNEYNRFAEDWELFDPEHSFLQKEAQSLIATLSLDDDELEIFRSSQRLLEDWRNTIMKTSYDYYIWEDSY